MPKGELKPKHLLVVDLDGHVLEGTGKASSESALHLGNLSEAGRRPGHHPRHPVTATALTVAGIPFRPDIVTEGALVLGPVPTVAYAPPGSAELATACAEAAEGADVFLMERHGAATVGQDLEQAFYAWKHWKP